MGRIAPEAIWAWVGMSRVLVFGAGRGYGRVCMDAWTECVQWDIEGGWPVLCPQLYWLRDNVSKWKRCIPKRLCLVRVWLRAVLLWEPVERLEHKIGGNSIHCGLHICPWGFAVTINRGQLERVMSSFNYGTRSRSGKILSKKAGQENPTGPISEDMTQP